MPDKLDRYRGSLLGLAIGDALGTTLEFEPPGTFDPISDIVGGGPFDLKAGEWTDDTSMALCLAQSLIERGYFDPNDQMERYVRWWKDGYLSSNGFCFDIGGTVMTALSRFRRTKEPYSGSTDKYSAGNGSIMRLAPVPLAFATDPEKAIANAADSSRTTHGAETAIDACRYLGMLIVGAVAGASKDELSSSRYSAIPGYWDTNPLTREIDQIATGSFKHREPPDIAGTGYVVRSLEAALWAFHNTDSFEEGCLDAVNLGDDADTTGAVYGQLAGAYYGVDGIPAGWREKLAHQSLIESFASGLFQLAMGDQSPGVGDPRLPHDRTYWVETGKLLAGYYPGDLSAIVTKDKLKAFLDVGIDTFIDLTEEGELIHLSTKDWAIRLPSQGRETLPLRVVRVVGARSPRPSSAKSNEFVY